MPFQGNIMNDAAYLAFHTPIENEIKALEKKIKGFKKPKDVMPRDQYDKRRQELTLARESLSFFESEVASVIAESQMTSPSSVSNTSITYSGFQI